LVSLHPAGAERLTGTAIASGPVERWGARTRRWTSAWCSQLSDSSPAECWRSSCCGWACLPGAPLAVRV